MLPFDGGFQGTVGFAVLLCAADGDWGSDESGEHFAWLRLLFPPTVPIRVWQIPKDYSVAAVASPLREFTLLDVAGSMHTCRLTPTIDAAHARSNVVVHRPSMSK